MGNSKFKKVATKVVAVSLSLTTAIWLSGAAMALPLAAKAATVEELQAQIAALLQQVTALQAQLAGQGGAAVATPACTFSRGLTVGMRGDDVKCLQTYLNVSPQSGYFGPLTKAAVAKWQADNSVSPAAGYFGTLSQAKYKALAGSGGTTPTPTPTPVPSTGLVAALASSNPAASTLPRGAASVTYLAFTVSGNGTLDTVTFKRTGLGATADFVSGGLYLYDGNTKLTTGRSLNSTSHEVTFTSLGLAVSGTKTLSLVADMAAGATVGNRNAFELVSSSPSLGSVKGNEMTISGATAGTITVESGAAPANPRAGQTGALLGEFRLTAGSAEDVTVSRLALTQGGTISNANLSNFVLKQGGNVIAKASAVSGRDLIVFAFDAPFALEKGQNRTFEVWGDIAAGARSNDTIILYVQNTSDVYAVGKLYGYGVTVTNTAIDTTGEADTLTLQAGQVTINFNGPAAGDLAARATDATVYKFSLSAQNNVEVRNLRFSVTTTNLGAGEGFNDMKVWDADTNTVLSSSVDITTTTASQVYTDVINLTAGKTRNFKVTVDADSDNDAGDTITVNLLAFQANDLRNLDSNTYLTPGTDVVPNSTVAGNLMTVQTTSIEPSLSGTPTSRTVVAGSNDVDLVGVNMRAVTGNVRVNSLVVTATPTTGSHAQLQAELQNVAVYVGGTRISDVKSFTGSGASSITFSNLSRTINAGTQELWVVRAAQLATNATNTNAYRVGINDTATDITATDVDGNTVSAASLNLYTTAPVVTVGTATLTVSTVTNSDSEAGLVEANGERLLGVFDFYAANANVDVKKIKIGVSDDGTANASANLAQEVGMLKLYDGATLIATGSIDGSGSDAGRVKFDAGTATGAKLFSVNANTTKQLTVKAALSDMNTTTGAAVTNITAYIHNANFEATAGTQTLTTLTSAPVNGNIKRAYKTVPTVTLAGATSGTIGTGDQRVIGFTVTAGANEDVEWSQIKLTSTLLNATLTADSATAVDNAINLRSAGSSVTLHASSTVAATGGTVIVRVATPERIAKGTSKTYDLYLNIASLNTTNTLASVSTSILSDGTTTIAPAALATQVVNADSDFVWSDRSVTNHSTTTADWHNGAYVKSLPSLTSSIHN